jgi:hypothetical protein
MLNLLPSIIVLGLVALAAATFTARRASPPENLEGRADASRALLVALVIQGIHFIEEAATGLHVRLPALFGLPPIPFALFVGFNVLWLGIWIGSVPAIRRARPPAFFAAWFLAIAGALNGILHPLLAVVARGYFPGLVTSPFIGAAGVWLWIRLLRTTRPVTG